MSFIRRSAVALLALGALVACSDETAAPTGPEELNPTHAYTPPAEPVNGELIRQYGTATVYLVYNRTLYGIPDEQTLRACAGGRDRVVREVSSIPAWPKPALPSAGNPFGRPHGRAWMHGDNPVRSSNGTVYLVVGCVKSGIPNPDVYTAIFNGDWSRIRDVPDADLSALPTGPVAQPIPLRRAGTLLEYGGTVKWVTFHGGSLGLAESSTMDSHCRGWNEMSSAAEANSYAINGILQPGSYSCVRGNEYPFANQSYGTYRPAYDADPWQFWYRECTSFVAWRLNQDGIEFHNYYRGPHWGNADNWDNAAYSAGVRVDKTPRVGAVAQWNSMHVAYVSAVHTNGEITLEEYNRNYDGRYSYRRVSPSVVENFIHFR